MVHLIRKAVSTRHSVLRVWHDKTVSIAILESKLQIALILFVVLSMKPVTFGKELLF